MQMVNYPVLEQNLYYETDRLNTQEVFNINAIFDNISMTKCLAVIMIYEQTTSINIAYNRPNNICESYIVNPGETVYLQLNNPNDVFLQIKGDYKLKLKAYRLRLN